MQRRLRDIDRRRTVKIVSEWEAAGMTALKRDVDSLDEGETTSKPSRSLQLYASAPSISSQEQKSQQASRGGDPKAQQYSVV